jgi:hypothetical protein
MKNFLIFLGGFIAGILATLLFSYFAYTATKSSQGVRGLTTFPQKGECIIKKGELKIFQVMQPNMALANTGDDLDGIMVLLINHDGKAYYDDEKITIPAKKCARQIGTYQYTTTAGYDKTVPAVMIE